MCPPLPRRTPRAPMCPPEPQPPSLGADVLRRSSGSYRRGPTVGAASSERVRSNHDRDKGGSGGRVTSFAMSSPPTSSASLHGWGRTAPTLAHVTVPRSQADVAAAVRAAGPRGVIARGLGRSYGDPAQNAGGLVLDMTGLARPPAIDADTGVAVVDGGVSLDTLMRAALPLGWWVPVLPGTRQVTIGGAIGAGGHGKNHQTKGSFGNHVLGWALRAAAGTRRPPAPGGPPAQLVS